MAVAPNNNGTMTRTTTFPTSNSFSVTAGTNLVAFAQIAYDAGASDAISGVTYGGVAMASAGAAANEGTGHEYAEIWWLTTSGGLLTGSNLLAVTFSAGPSVEAYVNLVTFTGADQTTPIRPGSYTTRTSTASPNAITIPSAVGDYTITCINGGASGFGTTDQTGYGAANNTGTYSGWSDRSTSAAAGSSVVHTWTGPIKSAVAGLSIQAASASSSFVPLIGGPGGGAGMPCASIGGGLAGRSNQPTMPLHFAKRNHIYVPQEYAA